jgi:excinuclease ABC subunit A
MDVIKLADWVIDLGPEGGDRGGEIVATGRPEEVARNPKSFTGQWLRGVLPGFPEYDEHRPRCGKERDQVPQAV